MAQKKTARLRASLKHKARSRNASPVTSASGAARIESSAGQDGRGSAMCAF
jgi:hypothetical protein